MDSVFKLKCFAGIPTKIHVEGQRFLLAVTISSLESSNLEMRAFTTKNGEGPYRSALGGMFRGDVDPRFSDASGLGRKAAVRCHG